MIRVLLALLGLSLLTACSPSEIRVFVVHDYGYVQADAKPGEEHPGTTSIRAVGVCRNPILGSERTIWGNWADVNNLGGGARAYSWAECAGNELVTNGWFELG